jgi:N-acetylglucosamine kinase-like BadF-type ATPase
MLARAFTSTALTARTEVLNDTLAALRAGTDHPYGVVLICGAGVNAAAVGPTGSTARLAALGPISGDRGGGRDLGMGALGAAVRARDGRGPRTAFERLVPAHFGLKRPDAVTRAIYDGRIAEYRVLELAPVVFGAARGGDAVARGLLDSLADELATMAVAMIRRVGLAKRAFDVVLAGGVFQNHDDAFLGRLETAVRTVAPRARLAPLHSPPLVGAALLGLDRIGSGVTPAAERRLRDACAAMGTPPRI